ncbi:MAG: DEAD/DEAH box helicase [bacterium]|nr:DEAD/DEAH box helicase [bacterium]
MASSKGFGFLFEMGTGKTLTSIATMGAAYQMGAIESVLVVAPTSVCPVWPKDLAEYADFRYRVGVLLGDKDKRLRELEAVRSYPLKGLKIAVINYESTWRDGIFDALMDWKPDMIIADESQRIKTHNAQQSKAMHQLGDAAKYKLILSGTPVQNNAIDIYSQYRFLDPTVFGTNYFAFRGRYAIMGGFNQRQIIGYRDLDTLIKKEFSIAYRVTKEEALDLPEQTFITRNIPLQGKAKKLYDTIKRDSFAELESGGKITAPTVLTKLLRLQQFTGGFIQPDEGVKPEWVFDGKLLALEDILDDYVIGEGKKLVVFCRFRPEIDIIQRLFEKKKIQYASIYGDIKIEDRGPIVKDFQTKPEIKVFLAQIDTAGLGITLTAADTCVYYSKNFNYAAYSQSLARIHRIGQKNTCTYIDLSVEGTIDELISKALSRKEDLAKTIVDDWRSYF